MKIKTSDDEKMKGMKKAPSKKSELCIVKYLHAVHKNMWVQMLITRFEHNIKNY